MKKMEPGGLLVSTSESEKLRFPMEPAEEGEPDGRAGTAIVADNDAFRIRDG